MAVASCEAAGIPYSVVNIYAGESTRQSDTALAANLAAPSRAPYPINIFCLTGFETARVYFEQGAGLFEHRYNIGCASDGRVVLLQETLDRGEVLGLIQEDEISGEVRARKYL